MRSCSVVRCATSQGPHGAIVLDRNSSRPSVQLPGPESAKSHDDAPALARLLPRRGP